MSEVMTETLSYIEVIKQKQAVEAAIAKMLEELQEQTGALVHSIAITKLIGSHSSEIKVSININH